VGLDSHQHRSRKSNIRGEPAHGHAPFEATIAAIKKPEFRNSCSYMMHQPHGGASSIVGPESPVSSSDSEDIDLMWAELSKHQACTHCGKPGMHRPCCDDHVCNECYYSKGKCPSCNQKTRTSRFQAARLRRPSDAAAFWVMAILLLIVAVPIASMIDYYVSDAIRVKTVFGHTCARSAKRFRICIQDSSLESNGTRSANRMDWKRCDLEPFRANVANGSMPLGTSDTPPGWPVVSAKYSSESGLSQPDPSLWDDGAGTAPRLDTYRASELGLV